MNKEIQLKFGIGLTSVLMLMSILFVHYGWLASTTLRDVFLIPCFIVNSALLWTLFKKRS